MAGAARASAMRAMRDTTNFISGTIGTSQGTDVRMTAAYAARLSGVRATSRALGSAFADARRRKLPTGVSLALAE
jgi:hypothetical protein